MNNDFENPLVSNLQDGEQIVWQGKPNKKRMKKVVRVVLLPFGVIWIVFTLGGAILVHTQSPHAGPMGLVLALFSLIGFAMVFGFGPIVSKIADNTFFLLTDRRALIQSSFWLSRKFFAVEIADVPAINLQQHKWGLEAIYFGNPSFNNTNVPTFAYIDDIDEVYKLVLETKKNAGDREAS